MSKNEIIDDCIPPFDLVGKYYDELSQEDKQRYWDYYYEKSYSLEEAEALELKYLSHTLHFVCEINPADYPWGAEPWI